MVAWEKVKDNKGCYGIDEESIKDFNKDLKDNLYKIWNRMSSGTYFPPAVKAVEIPKSETQMRLLGIPTVSDRVAQAVAKLYLEPIVDPKFHEDSYGYRPGKSALEAVGLARRRCWRHDWVIDLDIKGFFDNLDHDLVMKAVRFHTDEKWIHLYVERWLKAPLQQKDRQLVKRDKGTPQGGVISPLLANIFMHHAFDEWMRINFPSVKFERFADDVLLHCHSLDQAKKVLESIKARLKECGLEVNPEKTKIVYCKDGKRRLDYSNNSFDFLGYTFRPRKARNRYGKIFLNFTPAVSNKAKSEIMEKVKSWKLHRKTNLSVIEIAKKINPVTRGWINFYGEYYKSALYSLFFQLDKILIRWSQWKFKKLRTSLKRTLKWWGRIAYSNKHLFSHWKLVRSF
jgi:RNA-directed DNA polymerase